MVNEDNQDSNVEKSNNNLGDPRLEAQLEEYSLKQLPEYGLVVKSEEKRAPSSIRIIFGKRKHSFQDEVEEIADKVTIACDNLFRGFKTISRRKVGKTIVAIMELENRLTEIEKIYGNRFKMVKEEYNDLCTKYDSIEDVRKGEVDYLLSYPSPKFEVDFLNNSLGDGRAKERILQMRIKTCDSILKLYQARLHHIGALLTSIKKIYSVMKEKSRALYG